VGIFLISYKIPIFKNCYRQFKTKQENLDHLIEHQDLLDRLDTPGTPDYVRKVEKEKNEQNLYYKRAGTPGTSEYRRKTEKEQKNIQKHILRCWKDIHK
jgi:hypothetical protein